jgi:hypothetical protein
MEQTLFEGERADPMTTALQTMHTGMTDLDGRLNELALAYNDLTPVIGSLQQDLVALGDQARQELEKLHVGIQQVHQDSQTRTQDLGRDMHTLGFRLFVLTGIAGGLGLFGLLEALLRR